MSHQLLEISPSLTKYRIVQRRTAIENTGDDDGDDIIVAYNGVPVNWIEHPRKEKLEAVKTIEPSPSSPSPTDLMPIDKSASDNTKTMMTSIRQA